VRNGYYPIYRRHFFRINRKCSSTAAFLWSCSISLLLKVFC